MANEWKEFQLSDICTFQNGYAFKSDDFSVNGTPVIKIRELKDGEVKIFNDSSFISVCLQEYGSYIVQPGDVLIALTGDPVNKNNPLSWVGRVAKYRGEKVCLLNQRVCRVQPDKEYIEKDFIYYFFRIFDNFYNLASKATGSASQANISTKTIGAMRIKIPALPEQRAIAHILGTLDDKIELNRRMNEMLEEMARALFKAWFVDFEPARAKLEGRWRRGQSLPGLPAHLYDLFPDRLVDSDLGEIPKGWETGILGNVSEHPRRSKRPEEIAPETPYIALEHMPKRRIALAEWDAANGLESNKYEFKRGEILFGKLRPYFHKVGIAPIDGVCSTDIIVLTPIMPIWYGFVLSHVSSDAFVEYTNSGATGTKMPRTSWSEISRYLISLPPENVAAAFNLYIMSVSEKIILKIHESKLLTELRDTLLPKLISGELHVKNLDRFIEETIGD